MKEALLFWAVTAVIALVTGAIGGVIAANVVAQNVLDHAGTERAEAQATFTEPNEAVIEFPAVVRGRRVACVIYVNTKRKASSVIC